MLEKARQLEADEIVIDLEDSVPAVHKHEARARVCEALRDRSWRAPAIAVRINSVDSHWAYRDVIDVIEAGGERLSTLVIPKVEGASAVDFVDRLAGLVEQAAGAARPIGLELLIETATGLRRAHESACASARVRSLIVGYADLAASLGYPASDAKDDDQRWTPILQMVILAARDAGVQALDGPYFDIADLDGLRRQALRSAHLGYDGKWAIHPSQVKCLNETYSPTRSEFEAAAALLGELDRAESESGSGATLHRGQMIDEAMRKQANRVVARGLSAGLERSPS